jgi:hypothetical protein
MADDEHGTGDDVAAEGPTSPRELVVIVAADAEVRARADGLESLAGADVDGVRDVLERHGATMATLFGETEPRLHARSESVAASSGEDVPDLAVFYRVDAPDEVLDELAEALREQDVVEAAYVKPPAQPPLMILGEEIAPSLDAPPDHTPDLTARQGYLDAAPGGIDARWAWTQPGGRGAGVRIVDVEGAWRWTHEDLRQNQGGTAGGTDSTDLRWRNHGTNVVGEFGGDRNAFGVTGITTDAFVRGVSIFGAGMGSARAIERAAQLLSPGDLLLIELHRPGPRFDYANRDDQRGFIPVEWWEDDFAAIRFAVARGVVVVEAAGNGAENLDDALYQTRPAHFAAGWTNPLRRSNRDSGAILVGAGAPPPGTHGRDHGPDRSRLDFSNWGASVDAQGWGREVTTTGGRANQAGDLQGGTNEDEWYTDRFSGTSSASPIVVGALASVQGALRARGRIPLSPARARQLLRATGSVQQDAPGRPATQRIGRRPNLRQLIPMATQAVTPWTGVQFTGSLAARQTRCWFTFNWPAHWHVVWTVVPTTPRVGAPQIRWRVRVERASDSHVTYWICITNLTGHPVNVEGRYGVLGW